MRDDDGPFASSIKLCREIDRKHRAWMKSLSPQDKAHLDSIERERILEEAESIRRVMRKLGAKRWLCVEP